MVFSYILVRQINLIRKLLELDGNLPRVTEWVTGKFGNLR